MMTPSPEARVLGKLLVLQQHLELFPNLQERIAFIQRALREVPGLADVRFCFREAVLPACPGAAAIDTCFPQRPAPIPLPPRTPQCCLTELAASQTLPLRSSGKLYGYMILIVADPIALSAYTPYLVNTANSLANLLEKQAMNGELQRLLQQLERQVESRTTELARKNTLLEQEIEQRRQIEAELRQAYEVLEHRVQERTAALAASEERLRDSEAFIRRVLDNLFIFVGVLLPDGTVIEMNRAPLESAGIALDEIRGHKLWECVSWNYSPEVQQQLMSAIAQAAEGQTLRYDIEIRTGNGEYLPIDFMLAPLRDTHGRITHLIPSGIPIAERRRMEQALRDADRRKDEFLAMLGHELRNPLAPIRNATQILRIRTRQLVEFQRPIDIIERQLGHLTQLVDDLLDVSRITQGKITLQKRIVDLATVVQRAVEVNQPLIDQHRHKLLVRLPSLDIQVEGDEVRLVQVVANLLNNAAKYSPDGSRIDVEVTVEGENAVLRVWDTGMGITAELMPYLFELFSQGERGLDRAQGGLGIGLALVRSLVRMHGGQIEAHSAGTGQGSEFIIRLPRLIQTPSTPAATSAPATEPARSQLGVLVVDDNADAAESIASLLAAFGYDTHTAHDGHTALDAYERYRPDAVLLDIGLPGMDGYEVARRLRARTPTLTLIAVTGYGQSEDRERALAAGFDHHCVKPVDTEELLALLDSLRPA